MAQNSRRRAGRKPPKRSQTSMNHGNGEPSQSQTEPSGANSEDEMIKLTRREFYNSETKKPVYSAKHIPFKLDAELIGKGAQANLYKTTIKGGYFSGKFGYVSNAIARKEFQGPQAEDNFLFENQVCQDLPENSKSIIPALFSYASENEQGVTHYNICYEFAEGGDLRTWLSKGLNFPGGNSLLRVANIERMFNIAQGLQWLSEEIVKVDGRHRAQNIMHLDLHWRNILVCKDASEIGSGGWTFKIGDFGSARKGKYLKDPKNSAQAQISVGVGQFSPPEPQANERSDVWSFGCNLLLVLVFNYDGVGGLNEFLASLLRQSNQDWFYDRSTGTASHETTSCIEHLRRRIENEPDRLVTIRLLDLLQQKVLVPVKHRSAISDVVHAVRRSVNERKKVVPKIMVESRKGSYHYCAHAPRGKFEIFHHDPKDYTMSVWNWHNGMVSELPSLEPISAPPRDKPEYQLSRIYPRSPCCGEEHICQIVANCDPLEILLYQVPARFGEPIGRECIRLTSIPDVSEAALAPNAKYIAIDTNYKLRLYKRQCLLESMKMIDNFPSKGPVYRGLSQLGVCGIEFDLLDKTEKTRSREEEVTQILSFSPDSQHLYHGYRSQFLGEKNNFDRCITVDVWSTAKRTLEAKVTVEKQKIGSTEFLIALKPFNKRLGFLAATCYNCLTCYTFSEGEERTLSTIEIQDDNIKAVLIHEEDDYAVLIGTGQCLSVYVVDVQSPLVQATKLELWETSTHTEYLFDQYYDAASIVDRETLLISYHGGLSVHITLTPALDTCLGDSRARG
ncbi:hypothetical protein HBI69_130800 [Parastagonospora nodorum]|nr:hypothetical protein HBI69_130800 [Parastagonospora nodorum]